MAYSSIKVFVNCVYQKNYFHKLNTLKYFMGIKFIKMNKQTQNLQKIFLVYLFS